MQTALLLVLLLPVSSPDSGSHGTITGRVTILERGGVPRKSAGNVVVWVEGVSTRMTPQAGARERMESNHKSFTPRVLVVPVGIRVDFPNVDPIFHNVFSLSLGNRFDLGLYRRGAARSKTFEEPGLVRVYCNIHPQMVGYIYVVDTPAYAKTGEDGSYRIEGVPPGSRNLRFWSEEGGEQTRMVRVVAGQTMTENLTIDASGFKPQPHKNKYGKDYPPPPPEDERY